MSRCGEAGKGKDVSEQVVGADRQTETQTDRQRRSQTERHAGRQTETQTDRDAGRQTEK